MWEIDPNVLMDYCAVVVFSFLPLLLFLAFVAIPHSDIAFRMNVEIYTHRLPLNRRIYVDSRLHTLLDLQFDRPFFQRGDYPSVWWNGSTPQPLSNPWANASVTNAAPFDQEFFLIMNVAAGGTTGWFPDGQGNKPWLNQAESKVALSLIFGIFC
jgi:hypothetical protein